ncbi:MAG: N-acetylmuramoyl-L-alanine amidase [Shimia sp.]
MGFTRHWYDGAERTEAYHRGGKITPEIVVLHDTAGRLDRFNSRDYLASNNGPKVSVHFVIERDGTVSQLVPTNRRANHAGRSRYNGREWCNGFSIGIELVNAGRMTDSSPDDDGSFARAWWGEEFEWADGIEFEYAATKEHGRGLWMSYPEAQIDALIDLLDALFAYEPLPLKDIVSHWYISPGRKVDTNPFFPLEQIRARVLGRDDPRDLEVEEASIPAELMAVVETPGDRLNLRRWPSFNPNVLEAIPHETLLQIERTGTFEGRDWLRVQYGGHEGWIVADHTRIFERPAA